MTSPYLIDLSPDYMEDSISGSIEAPDSTTKVCYMEVAL